MRKMEIILLGIFLGGIVIIELVSYLHMIPLCSDCEGYFTEPEAATAGSLIGSWVLFCAVIGIPIWIFTKLRSKRKSNV